MDKTPFDFHKYEIDASVVLRKIWVFLQSSLSNPEVTRLNATFVSEDIFHPSEITGCRTSQNFLELLGGRLNPEKAKAINIICSEPVHKGIREVVQAYFPNDSVSSAGSSTSNRAPSASGDVIIVQEPTQVELIIKVLYKDDALCGKWQNLAYSLGLKRSFIEPLRIGVIIGTFEYKEVLRRLVQEWMTLNGDGATVTAFCKILNSEELIMSEENVERAFRRN